MIVTTLLGTDSLDTTGGPVSVQKALLRTPAGLCEGLLSPGSPRILPGMELSRYRLFVCVGGQAFIKGCDGKLVECPVHEDIPYLPEDMQISAWPYRTPNNDNRNEISHEGPEEGLEEKSSDFMSAENTPDPIEQIEKDLSACISAGTTRKRAEVANDALNARVSSDEASGSLEKATAEQTMSKAEQEAWLKHLLTHHPKCDECEICKLGKLPFTGHRRQANPNKANSVGEKVYTDLCTSWPPAKGNGERSFIGALDEASGLVFLEPLRGEISSAVLEALLRFMKELDAYREFHGLPKPRWQIIKSDWGGEFTALKIRDTLSSKGINFEHGVPARHVAAAERLMRTLASGIRTLLLAAGLPAIFWSFAGRAYAHNSRCTDPKWVAYAKANGKPHTPRVFGQLLYVKLPDVPLSKSDPPGTACAFLGYENSKTTNGMYVAYLKNNKIAVTLVDGRDLSGVMWPDLKSDGSPPMAFQRIVKNLNVLIVPGERVESDTVIDDPSKLPSPIRYDGPVVPDKNGRPGFTRPVRDPNSPCPACRGRKRGHTYSVGCQLEGQKPPRTEDSADFDETTSAQSNEEAKPKPKPRRGRKASRRAAVAPREDDKCQPTGGAQSQLERSDSSLDKPSGLELRTAEQTCTELAARENPPADIDTPQCLSTSIASNVSPAYNSQQHPSAPEQNLSTSIASNVPSANTAERFARMALDELEKSQLVHPDESSYGTDPSEHCDAAQDFVGLGQKISPTCRLTRKMTKAESQSEQGQAAVAKEMHKMAVEYSSFGTPIESSAAPVGSTVSGICMLTHIKNFERAVTEWVWKGRAVILGNKVRPIHSSYREYTETSVDDPHSNADDASPGINDIAALEEARLCEAWSLICGYSCQQIDVENGYLQEKWDVKQIGYQHYIRIPAHLWALLPSHLQPRTADGRKLHDPVWPMLTCIYGHPLSGSLFISGLLSLLMSIGFKPVGKRGSRALLAKGKTLVSAYVDDVKASGPDHELAEMWSALGQRYPFKAEPKVCSDFLGTSIVRRAGQIDLDMRNYCIEIFETYKSVYGTPRASRTPISSNLRVFDRVSTIPQKIHQKLVGMMNWLARTSRPDLSFAVSCIGSRLTFWTSECDRELERCVSYIYSTADAVLRMTMGDLTPGPDCIDQLQAVCYSDADWSVPRSQNGFIFVLENRAQGAFIPIFWGSKKQPFTAESAAAAEGCAAYYGLRESLPVVLSLTSVVDQPDCSNAHDASVDSTIPMKPKLILRTDNSQIVSLSRTGESDKLFFSHKATNTRVAFLRDSVARGWLTVEKWPTRLNPSNLLTKVLGRLQLNAEAAMCGLVFNHHAAAQSRAAIWRRRANLTS